MGGREMRKPIEMRKLTAEEEKLLVRLRAEGVDAKFTRKELPILRDAVYQRCLSDGQLGRIANFNAVLARSKNVPPNLQPIELYNAYKLRLMSELPENGIPKKDTLYLAKQNDKLIYKVMTPMGNVVEDTLDINTDDVMRGELNTGILNILSKDILEETSKRGHVVGNDSDFLRDRDAAFVKDMELYQKARNAYFEQDGESTDMIRAFNEREPKVLDFEFLEEVDGKVVPSYLDYREIDADTLAKWDAKIAEKKSSEITAHAAPFEEKHKELLAKKQQLTDDYINSKIDEAQFSASRQQFNGEARGFGLAFKQTELETAKAARELATKAKFVTEPESPPKSPNTKPLPALKKSELDIIMNSNSFFGGLTEIKHTNSNIKVGRGEKEGYLFQSKEGEFEVLIVRDKQQKGRLIIAADSKVGSDVKATLENRDKLLKFLVSMTKTFNGSQVNIQRSTVNNIKDKFANIGLEVTVESNKEDKPVKMPTQKTY
jgi:Skp family chaperone for outer membrane proteins